LIDMGDFVGGTLKYLRKHPLPRLTIAGGVAKMTKLAQGLLDLHSKRGAVDLIALAALAQDAGASPALRQRILAANTAAEAFGHAVQENLPLGDLVARAGWRTAARVLEGTDIALEVAVFDREGQLVGRAPFAPAHGAVSPRKRR
jgi:cobalt-precorrin-5B (C1)-methyltransferase